MTLTQRELGDKRARKRLHRKHVLEARKRQAPPTEAKLKNHPFMQNPELLMEWHRAQVRQLKAEQSIWGRIKKWFKGRFKSNQ